MQTIDLFSGAGGFTTGAERAGARVVWAANHWQAAVACHAANHPHIEHVEQDLSEMDWTLCPDADLILASPACQGFSQCGQPARRGTGGNVRPDAGRARVKGQRDRNTTWAVLAAADSLRPQSIVIENVVDLLKWDVFDGWRQCLHALGYETRVHVLNALDYGGSQDRERVVITANLGKPIQLAPGIARARGTIGLALMPDEDPENRWTELDSKPDRMQWRMRKAQGEAGRRCFWANVSESRGRALHEPFPTSTTKSASQWYLLDGDRGRLLNPREMARSMSFPDSYRLPCTRGLAGKLIGNAIDVNFAHGIVEQVLTA
jgi:DNA (cytosine-5)-methyltransferase 1